MTRILVLLVSFFYVFHSSPVKGQETKLYDSIVNIKGDLYHGEFQYYINKKDTIYNGPFQLTQQIEELSVNNSFQISSINGYFNNDIPDNAWVISKTKFSPTERGALHDYFYTFKINGTELLTKGSFDNGNKVKPWEIYEWEINNSEIQDTLLYGKIPYDSISINGDLNFNNRGQSLHGKVQNQLADGKWLFYSTDSNGNEKLLKEWIFQGNVLIAKVLYQGDQQLKLVLQANENSNAIIEEMELSKRYFTIIDLQSAIADSDLFNLYTKNKKVEDLYFTIINELKAVDSVFYPISKNRISPQIKAKIQKVPYSKEEKVLLTNIQENVKKSSQIIKILQKDVQVNLARLSNNQVAKYISTAKAIEKSFLSDILYIVHHFEKGNLEYINRDKFIHLSTTMKSQLQVKHLFKDDSSTFNYVLSNYTVEENSDPTKQLKAFTNDILQELNLIKDSIDSYVKDIKKEEDLSEVESILFQKYEEMKNLADSLITEQNNDIAGFEVREAINDYLDEIVRTYSALENPKEKNEAIDFTLNCLNSSRDLIHTIERAPTNFYTIRDAYTREVFNPYTYTNMQEKIKPGIYKSFEEEMLPAVYSKIKTMNCKNLESYTENFSILFEGMLELLKIDTDQLERKVKRAKDAKKAADLLGFQLKI